MIHSDIKNQRLLFIGFGNVGKKVIEIFSAEKKKFPALKNYNPDVIGIFTKSHGSIENDAGIDLLRALDDYNNNRVFSSDNRDITNISSIKAVDNLDYDILVELSTLSIKEKGEPAVSYVRNALLRNKHVVTANKGTAAFAYRELKELSEKNNRKFLFESSVMDGAPIFNMAKSSLIGCEVLSISGILNSTTNYILSQLEKGESFDEAVKIAQAEGFAEANPENDIEGWDAAAKIAVLSNALMKADITPFDVEREGIANVTINQAQDALRKGNRLKIVCSSQYENGKLKASVKLKELSVDHPFSKIDLSSSILNIQTDLMHSISIVENDPDIYDTAYGVINDLLTIASY